MGSREAVGSRGPIFCVRLRKSNQTPRQAEGSAFRMSWTREHLAYRDYTKPVIAWKAIITKLIATVTTTVIIPMST